MWLAWLSVPATTDHVAKAYSMHHCDDKGHPGTDCGELQRPQRAAGSSDTRGTRYTTTTKSGTTTTGDGYGTSTARSSAADRCWFAAAPLRDPTPVNLRPSGGPRGTAVEILQESTTGMTGGSRDGKTLGSCRYRSASPSRDLGYTRNTTRTSPTSKGWSGSTKATVRTTICKSSLEAPSGPRAGITTRCSTYRRGKRETRRR